jgi:hypothetical protein
MALSQPMRLPNTALALKKKAAVASDLKCRGNFPLKGTTPQGRATPFRNGIIK